MVCVGWVGPGGNVMGFVNVGINTTMWNFGLHIQNLKCYLYTNWSLHANIRCQGDSLTSRSRARAFERF